ncbi:MAG: lipopolysaccharide kinase InaA family protein [Gammaproteobacteria bacterium]
MIKEYWCDDWQKIFSNNNLDCFDAIWNLKTDWFEEPNQRRGGWSGVVKFDLDTPRGAEGVFIKRQENHSTKSFLHPISGVQTFEREFRNILRLQKKGLPILDLVYFAKRKVDGNDQAILITKELTDYIPLDSERFLVNGDLITTEEHKVDLINKVTDALKKIHQFHYQHNCLYLKHIFVKPVNDSWDVKLIDLEKLKWCLFKKDAVFRDLFTLHRHSESWSNKMHLKFFKSYTGEKKLSSESKKLLCSIKKKVDAKRK